VKWYRKAVEQNYAEAQYMLGVCYAKGEGVTKDQVEAVKWYRKAAEQNYAAAEYWLGVCYANGFGVAKDQVEAVKWYRKAAEQNYAEAQYNLAGGASSNAGAEDNSSNNIGANERYSFRARGNPWIVRAAFIAVTIAAIWGLFQAVARRSAVIVIALAILVLLVIPHGAGRHFVLAEAFFAGALIRFLQIRGGKEVVFRGGAKASTATKVGLLLWLLIAGIVCLSAGLGSRFAIDYGNTIIFTAIILFLFIAMSDRLIQRWSRPPTASSSSLPPATPPLPAPPAVTPPQRRNGD
jgi:hypothetical protein